MVPRSSSSSVLTAWSAPSARWGSHSRAVIGPAIAFLEFFGGIALVLGLFTQPVALLIAVDMLGAIALVKINKGLVGGYEFELVLLASALVLALAGAGEYSLDRVLATRKAERRRDK